MVRRDVQFPLSWSDNSDSLNIHACCSSCRPFFLLFYPLLCSGWHLLNPATRWERAHAPVLCIMSAHSLRRRKLYGLHKRWHKSPGIICKWMDPFPTSYHYSSDFPTTAWGNFCTSFQTKGISVLLTSHCGKQFVTFHKNDLQIHQQLFPRRLLGGCVPAQQLEGKVT